MVVYTIAIIGLGPKGLYSLERLVALAQNLQDVKINILVYEKSGCFGAGEVYGQEQEGYLLMNFPSVKINAWTTEGSQIDSFYKYNFEEWLLKFHHQEKKYAPRKVVGQYLQFCYSQIKKYAPNTVTIHEYDKEVIAIKQKQNNSVLQYKKADNSVEELVVQDVMITTGHCSFKGGLQSSQVIHNDKQHINFIYPIHQKLRHITAESVVGIKGLGLTSIDAILGLTEGRGGMFIPEENGSLVYKRSNREPQLILPFSRSGIPMVPRSGEEFLQEYTPVYFTKKKIYDRKGTDKMIDFEKHVLPLLQQEIVFNYYKVKFKEEGIALTPYTAYDLLKNQIEQYHKMYPNETRFTFYNFLKTPWLYTNNSSSVNEVTFYEDIIKEALKGEQKSAFFSAAMTWGNVNHIFNDLFSFKKMTPKSYEVFNRTYKGIFNRLSYGPPVDNMNKIVALIKANIIDLRFVAMPKIENKGEEILLKNNSQKSVVLHTMIDARIPSAEVKNWSTLFKNMHNDGIIYPASVGDYTLGGPDINTKGYAINNRGTHLHNICFYGTPTEGMVHDNDTLARSKNNFASHWAQGVVQRIQEKRKEKHEQEHV